MTLQTDPARRPNPRFRAPGCQPSKPRPVLLATAFLLASLVAAPALLAQEADPLVIAAQTLQSGQPEAALEQVEAVLAATPQDRDALVLLGQVRERLGEDDAAIAAYQQAIAAAPEWGPGYLQLGILYMRQDRLAAALGPLERAATLLPAVPLAQVLAGVALRENGRPEDAVTAFDRALVLDDADPNLWLDAAITRQAAGDAAGAVAAAEEAFRRAPGRPDVAVARARFLALSDDPELRFRTPGAYRAALALDTDRRLLWGELAEVYAELSMHEEAAGAYREVLALDDSNAIDHMNLGFSLARQGLFEQGAAAYDRALELDPEQGWAYYYRSECRINLDRQAEALADLEAAIARLPGQIVPLLAAVKLNSERGQHDVADAYLEQAVALQPRNAEVGLAQAKSLLRQQRAEEALPILEALVAGVPQMIDARYQLGQALMRLGRTDEGRQVLADYQQLLQRQTADQQGADREQVADRVRVHVMRGEVFLGEERLDDARGQFEAAAELAPEDAEVLRALLRCLETIGDEPAAAAIRDRIAALG